MEKIVIHETQFEKNSRMPEKKPQIVTKINSISKYLELRLNLAKIPEISNFLLFKTRFSSNF